MAALGAGLLAWHGRPRPEPIPAPAVLAGSGLPGSPVSTASSSLVVAVTGKVRRPGVVTVPVGARVIDAVQAAGGPLPGADLALLNLARKLADGELVVVGLPGRTGALDGGVGGGGPEPGGAAAVGGAPVGPGAPVDLNTATLAELDALPGVGPVLGQRILDWRTTNGRFDSVDQLANVPGIGESRMAQLRDLVRV